MARAIAGLTALAEQSGRERASMSFEALWLGYLRAMRRQVVLAGLQAPRLLQDSCTTTVKGYHDEIIRRLGTLSESAISRDKEVEDSWNTKVATLAVGGA